MIEKIKSIKNPLTVIAIFAALTEVSGTLVLPFLSGAQQVTFMWFVIIFPVLLLACFFLTLNLNPCVLYAPSDFQEDSSYLIAAGKLDAPTGQEAINFGESKGPVT